MAGGVPVAVGVGVAVAVAVGVGAEHWRNKMEKLLSAVTNREILEAIAIEIAHHHSSGSARRRRSDRR